jgi:hypothetical protein
MSDEEIQDIVTTNLAPGKCLGLPVIIRRRSRVSRTLRLRDKLRRTQEAAGDSAAEGSHDDVDAASKSAHGAKEFDFAELNREDVDQSAKERPSVDRRRMETTGEGSTQSKADPEMMIPMSG